MACLPVVLCVSTFGRRRPHRHRLSSPQPLICSDQLPKHMFHPRPVRFRAFQYRQMGFQPLPGRLRQLPLPTLRHPSLSLLGDRRARPLSAVYPSVPFPTGLHRHQTRQMVRPLNIWNMMRNRCTLFVARSSGGVFCGESPRSQPLGLLAGAKAIRGSDLSEKL